MIFFLIIWLLLAFDKSGIAAFVESVGRFDYIALIETLFLHRYTATECGTVSNTYMLALNISILLTADNAIFVALSDSLQKP